MTQRYEEGPVRIPNTDDKRELEMFLQNVAQTLRHRSRFPVHFYLTPLGVSIIGTMTIPSEGVIVPPLYVINISAWHNGAAVAGGDTTIVLNNNVSGSPDTLATFTLPAATAAYAVVSTDYPTEESIPDNARLTLAVGSDGGHRAIFCSAWFSQVPRRM